MSQRLSHLKSLIAGNAPTRPTDKTDGGASVSFVRDQGRHVSSDQGVSAEPTQRTIDEGSPDRRFIALSEKGLPLSPTKLTKGANVSSVSEQGAHVSQAELNCNDTNAVFEERAAISEFDGGLKRDQAEALAALQVMPLPNGVNEHQRSVIIDAAAIFLDQKRKRK